MSAVAEQLQPVAPKVPKKSRGKKQPRAEKGQGTVDFNGYSFFYKIPNPADPKGYEKKSGFPSATHANLARSNRYIEIQNERVGIKSVRELPLLEECTDLYLKARDGKGGYRAAKSRWKRVIQAFGKCRINEITDVVLVDWIEDQLADGFDASLSKVIMAIGAFYNDVRIKKQVPVNPVTLIPKNVRDRYRSRHDPKKTPFLKDQNDCARIYHHLALREEQVAVAYAIGAFTGFRTGEILGLWCEDFLLKQKLIHLQRQVKDGRLGPLESRESDMKDAHGEDRSRMVPILDILFPIVRDYIFKVGGKGPLFPPLRPGAGGRPDLGRAPEYMRASTLNRHLKDVLTKIGLPEMDWYHATKHTFASHYAMQPGANFRKLADRLGHSTTYVTERYAHLSPENYTDKDRAMFTGLDMSKKEGKVVPFGSRKNTASKRSPKQSAKSV